MIPECSSLFQSFFLPSLNLRPKSKFQEKVSINIREKSFAYMFVWLVLINGAYIFGRREHMNISYVRGKMSPGGQRILCVITEAVSCLFAVVVLVGGGLLAVNVGLPQKDAALEISMGIVYAALPISGVLTAFYTVCNIHDILTGRLDVVETLAKEE